jgi:Polyketide cyclase / dehydrase and lipid transport
MIAERRCFNVAMPDRTPDGVTTSVDADSVSATAVVDAPPAEVFDFLRRPENHAVVSGDESVRGKISGPELLDRESKFTMRMKVVAPYRVTSKVVEFEEDRVIAWCHFGGHRWRWELEPVGDAQTRLTETFDQSTSKASFLLRAAGYPRRHRQNVARSVANVAARFGEPPSGVHADAE